MRPHALINTAIAITVVLFVTPVAAELYKWTDERGVTNYSDQPPADPGAAKKLAVVEDSISVYTPDPTLLQAVESFRRRALNDRIEIVEAQRPQVIVIHAPAPQIAYDPIAASYRPDYHAIGSVGGSFPIHHRARLVQSKLPPGAIAGNVVGMSGIIPGNSAAAAPRIRAVTPSLRPLAEPRAIFPR
jgi:hypothetical protein